MSTEKIHSRKLGSNIHGFDEPRKYGSRTFVVMRITPQSPFNCQHQPLICALPRGINHKLGSCQIKGQDNTAST